MQEEDSSSSSSTGTRSSNARRHLLQNQWLWPRNSAAITASLTIVNALAASGSAPADGIKTAARGLEIARLASNKEADPWEYDRPAAPAQKPARQQASLGRRLRSLLEPL